MLVTGWLLGLVSGPGARARTQLVISSPSARSRDVKVSVRRWSLGVCPDSGWGAVSGVGDVRGHSCGRGLFQHCGPCPERRGSGDPEEEGCPREPGSLPRMWPGVSRTSGGLTGTGGQNKSSSGAQRSQGLPVPKGGRDAEPGSQGSGQAQAPQDLDPPPRPPTRWAPAVGGDRGVIATPALGHSPVGGRGCPGTPA